ncbi:CarD family transcriptional regulator [Bradyrhizobium sp. UNPF46]|uniref:CarD family transcriptional regulator n=1 Tax=Bradyrhizobium sp. UNPF46 TaxID=1141168 RepID=UPI001FF06042|nr:CarD family transcriptional regulator [Bradyrhizobium sp. UNPF46]
MGLFSGPSKYVTVRMGQGVASVALQLHHLRGLEAEPRKVILDGMKAEGSPTSMEELISAAASVIREHELGTWRKGQYLASIKASLLTGGMPQADANYLVGMIELDRGLPPRPSAPKNADITPPMTPEPAPQAPAKPAREEPSPRAAAAQSQGFKANEFVVYPAHGVGQILAIEEQEIAGAKLELFVINFIKDKMTLRVPTAKVAHVGMRKLSDPATVNRAQLVLASKPHVPEGDWSRIAQEYEAKINSGDIIALAEAVRDLYRPAINPAQSYGERQLYDAGLDRLTREISVVHHITEAEAVRDVESILIARPRQWSATT